MKILFHDFKFIESIKVIKLYIQYGLVLCCNCFPSCMEAQEHSLAGADDSSEYDDIRNVPPDYEIVMDSRSQPGINGSRNTAHGIPQGSLTAANGRVQ